jgi:glycine dehydrogenase subunit 1
MRFTQITDEQIHQMLNTIGVGSIDELFGGIPLAQRTHDPLDIPPGVSEPQLTADLEALASRNSPCDNSKLICFLGAGVYDQFIPAVVDYMASQSEFLTAYTPYQAEASQGSLQAFYEFQTMICQLTGMEVANASLYEQASAVAEAVIMAEGVTRRQRVLISGAIHPDSDRVLRTITSELGLELVRIPHTNGATDLSVLDAQLNDRTAAVVVQSPNFFGVVERVHDVVAAARRQGALVIQSVCPISCGLLKRPGEMDVDITVGEGQPLGIPMSYGGPFLGFFACREEYLRRTPGRIVGMTRDKEGRRGFCLTLQTREQHIRREKATSNICTNQGLLAFRAAIYLAALGRRGIREVAELCLDKAHYAASEITKLDGYQLRFDQPFFREFVVQSDRPVDRLLKHCRDRDLCAGVPLGQWFDDLADCFMVAVTEKRSKSQIDALVDALKTA